MFFITTLLNEIIRWMRATQRTSALRAILYMDEIYGFFRQIQTRRAKRR